ncbi:MAG: hypothetical protein SFY56_00390 [Bacteroidota bacterium]|nr:hypothetical protein [Bacteroidota bacterium]
MKKLSPSHNQIQCVESFHDLVSVPFHGEINAICWNRELRGDFSEIVKKVALTENIMVLNKDTLLELQLSEQGQLAREIILNDMALLKAHGADPILNLIKNYETDETHPFFPTDVYSFHVDRSPIPTNTFLCTYYGESSEILPNFQAEQKVLVPEIREELKKLFHGSEEEFESFLSEHFFDLHYRAKPNAKPIRLGNGNLWRLAVDCAESNVLPCIHRAPKEKTGENRLLLIC